MRPRFSIVTPVYNAPADVLAEMIESVQSQSFTNWQLVLIDDCSPSPHVMPILRNAAASDSRILVIERPNNGGIVAASNDGLATATGEFIGLLDHDDTLVVDALRLVDIYAKNHPEMDYCYSDEDLINAEGQFVSPFYKPDWSPERLRAQNYCTHFSVFRASLVEQIGGFRTGYDGSQDYDIILRATEHAREVVHIPFVLYHWRQIATSVASGDPSIKPYAYDAGRRAISEHCERVGIEADVVAGKYLGNYHVRRTVDPSTDVGLVMVTDGASRAMRGITQPSAVASISSIVASTSRPLNIVVVVDDAVPSAVRAAIVRAGGAHPVQLIDAPISMGLSQRKNLGAVSVDGDHLLFVHDAIEVTTNEFLNEMLGPASSNRIGAVGTKSYFSDGRLRHGGYVHNGGPSEIMRGFNGDELGHRGLLTVQREVASVSSSCLMARRKVFERAGGFSPHLNGAAADVDFGLKLGSLRYDRIWTPNVEVVDFTNVDDPSDDGADRQFLERRWGHQLHDDPYSNSNLQPSRGDWVEAGLR
jgi:O-antigen biosynthesis protein